MISLSLRDKSHSPIEGPRIKLALMGFPGLKPGLNPTAPPEGVTKCDVNLWQPVAWE